MRNDSMEKNNDSNEKKKRIVIMGAGVDAERLYYYLGDAKEKVSFLVDSNREGYFHDIPIKPWDAVKAELKNYYVLISSRKYYSEMREQLIGVGLREFVDFIKGACYGKKTVYINGNCYAEVYGKLLQSVEKFRDKYFVYYDTPLCDQEEYAEDILRECSVCLSQDVRDDNKYGVKTSLTWHKNNINKSAELIVVPNLVGLGKAFFPQSSDNGEKNNCEYPMLPYGMFPYSDDIIDKMILQGKDFNEILNTIKSNNVFSHNNIYTTFQRVTGRFIEREKNWDIKIMDYVMSHYKKEKIMYDLRHPNGNVFKEITNRILRRLNIDDEVKINIEVNDFEIPVYPCVAELLELQWHLDMHPTPLEMHGGRSSLDNYIKEYIYWCYERRNYELH